MATEKKKTKTPAWAWLFAALCALIPVFTLGGAIPGGIGIGGAFVCLGLARDTRIVTLVRIAFCLAITALCWVAVAVVFGKFVLLTS